MKQFHNEDIKRIDFLDERFYTIDGSKYFPSVTHVLGNYPKGSFFEKWLKDVGHNADKIKNDAAKEGSKMHDAIERLIYGQEVRWYEGFNFQEWLMISNFIDFYTTFEPIVESCERMMFSEVHEIGGTLDLVAYINGEKWLIDHKSSNAIQKTHYIQQGVYATLYNEINPDSPVERVGILHYKAKTKGYDKTGKKIQGKGWKLEELPKPIGHYFKLFKHTHAIWKEENPNYKPKNLSYPDSYDLKHYNTREQLKALENI